MSRLAAGLLIVASVVAMTAVFPAGALSTPVAQQDRLSVSAFAPTATSRR